MSVRRRPDEHSRTRQDAMLDGRPGPARAANRADAYRAPARDLKRYLNDVRRTASGKCPGRNQNGLQCGRFTIKSSQLNHNQLEEDKMSDKVPTFEEVDAHIQAADLSKIKPPAAAGGAAAVPNVCAA